jgi:RNA-directed DNA polymerase
MTETILLEVNGAKGRRVDWGTVSWQDATTTVTRLRQRIFRATQEGDFRTVRSLQKLMLKSEANRLVSVRRVTQINQGKRTAGIDGLTALTPQSRAALVEELAGIEPWKAEPARRVYIPKANGKQRPLGIPVIRDRALQAMVKNALEPEWEARFEPTSYGFRPGRGCHDAICQVRHHICGKSRMEWVLDADIEGAFDNIAHDYLKSVIGETPGWGLISQWLKAGYVEAGKLLPTEAGTPQGGVISPLLANIALHGMEEALTERNERGTVTDTGLRREYGKRRNHQSRGSRAVVRYADDFVVFTRTKEDAERVKEKLSEWLAIRGLRLSQEKTRIVHVSDGFDFLGFHLKQVEDTTGTHTTGVAVLSNPSAESIRKLKDRLRDEWEFLQGKSVETVLNRLNPIIRGWAQYFRIGTCHDAFRDMDEFLFRRTVRYANRMHKNKSTAWKRERYWGKLNPQVNDTWVFGDKTTRRYLLKFRWFGKKVHEKVSGDASPDDPSLKEYWEKRAARKLDGLTPSKKHVARRQGGLCPVCGEPLFNGDWVAPEVNSGEALHVHHRQSRKDGGTNAYRNLEIRHHTCHWQAHAVTKAEQREDQKRRPLEEEAYLSG